LRKRWSKASSWGRTWTGSCSRISAPGSTSHSGRSTGFSVDPTFWPHWIFRRSLVVFLTWGKASWRNLQTRMKKRNS
jgi:hypothetical protein